MHAITGMRPPSKAWSTKMVGNCVVGATVEVGGGGISTVSMTCTTPFAATLSADITSATPLMVTPPAEEDVMDTSCPCNVVTSCAACRSVLYTAAPDTTWYVKMSDNSSTLPGSNNLSSSAVGIWPNAALDGAKTVNGPSPSRAETRLPAIRAVTSVDRSLLL